MELKKAQKAKVILLLLFIIIFNFIFPIHSNAGFASGILTRPICFFIVHTTDGVNRLLNSILIDPGTASADFWDAVNNNTGLDKWINGKNSFLMSPDKIFTGKSKILNANIFEVEESTNSLEDILKGIQGEGIANALKKTVSNIYVLLRNISAVILLCLLIYTGIRILLISASPYDQAKWKQALIDWVKALCLLMFMHLIMIGIFYVSDLFVNSLGNSLGDMPIIEMIRNAYTNNNFWDDTEAIVTTIMYVYVTYLTVLFAIAYFKRLVWIVVLIVISPIVATTYALGQKQKGIFNKWFKEFVSAVIIQPFHMLIFYILVGIPLGAIGNTTTGLDFAGRFAFEPVNYAVYIYILISISMIRPAEKFLMGLSGIGEAAVAKKASSESGKQTVQAVERVAVETVKTVAEVGAVVATAGAAAGAVGAEVAGEGLAGLGETEELLGGLESPGSNELVESGFGAPSPGSNELVENGFGAPSPGSNELVENGFGYNNVPITSENASQVRLSDAAGMLGQAANRLTDAADRLSDAADNFEVSDAEFDEAMGDQTPKSKNKFMERLESNPLYNYAKSPEGKERFNELRAGVNELRDSMYLDEAPQEWKKGEFGYDNTKSRIDQSKKDSLNAFVNNKNNISYMKQAHDLSTEDAKKRLQEAEPYINRGITDIGAIDKMISAQREGRNPDQAIRAVAKETRTQANINKTVNDQSKINAVAQIIASSTGSRADSPKVQQQAKQTMEAARPYIAKGEKDPEVLHRLVQLENNLKNSKAGANVRTPDKVMRMDKKIDKAMKDGLNRVEMKTNQSTSQGMKQIESVMNKELRNRKALGSNNQN